MVLINHECISYQLPGVFMFLPAGFLGVFTALFLWPGLLIVHFSGVERLEWPDLVQWFYLVANGVIGTVLSELLWLW